MYIKDLWIVNSWMDDMAQWMRDNPGFYFLIMFGGIFLSMFLMGFAQKKFQGTFKKYSTVQSNSGMTGSQVAEKILEDKGINYVKVVKGMRPFADNFNPKNNTITLSPANYDSTSIAAVAVAAHEVGHAIQWDKNWIGIRIRNLFLVPAQLGSQLGWMSFFIGVIFSGIGGTGSSTAGMLMSIGFVLIGMITIFQFATLPVEFDASARAMTILTTEGYIEKGSEVHAGAKKVLTAAAWTYVVGLIVSLLELFRLFIIMLMNSRR